MGVAAVSSSRAPYGNYILRTGKGIVGRVELVLGAHWYRSRFAGRAPILDLGPGRCWFTKQNVKDIVAVDNASGLVDHFAGQGINIKLGTAYDIPFPEAYFEGAFCCWLFEHLAEPVRSIMEIHRVLKPGGYACIIVPSPNNIAAFYDDYTHVRPFTPTSLKQLADDAAFTRSRSEYLPWTRGLTQVLRLFGSKGAGRYLRFSDTTLRRAGLLNRDHLMLDAWK